MSGKYYLPVINEERCLLPVLVVVINTYKRAGEGKDFAEGNKDGGVNDADGREGEGGGEQCAPEDAHCDCRKKLGQRFAGHTTWFVLSS